MSQFILDISANTFKNDKKIVKKMMDKIKKIDRKKHNIIFKTQLFENAPPNLPLDHDIFDYMYNYGKELGYKVTASVFDLSSLKFLLNYDIPFVKIANRRNLDWLIREVPRKIPVYVSVSERRSSLDNSIIYMRCISKYPCDMGDYEMAFGCFLPKGYVSDHTTNWDMFIIYSPTIYECHYVLEHDKANPDGGLFARTPKMFKEVL